MSTERNATLFRAAVLALGCLGIGGCAPQGEVVASSPATRSPTAQIQTVQEASTPNRDFPTGVDLAEYRIRPDDILQIVVYQVPDFSRDAQVDAPAISLCLYWAPFRPRSELFGSWRRT